MHHVFYRQCKGILKNFRDCLVLNSCISGRLKCCRLRTLLHTNKTFILPVIDYHAPILSNNTKKRLITFERRLMRKAPLATFPIQRNILSCPNRRYSVPPREVRWTYILRFRDNKLPHSSTGTQETITETPIPTSGSIKPNRQRNNMEAHYKLSVKSRSWYVPLLLQIDQLLQKLNPVYLPDKPMSTNTPYFHNGAGKSNQSKPQRPSLLLKAATSIHKTMAKTSQQPSCKTKIIFFTHKV